MWWNDITEMKDWMSRLTERLVRIDHNVEKLLGIAQENSEKSLRHDEVEDCLIGIRDAFCPDDECSSINRIQEKLNTLVEDIDRKEAVRLSMKTLDKFEDYMKNVDKLNTLINEFKGVVSLARAAIAERKDQEKEFEELKNTTKVAKDIYQAMSNFITAGNSIEKQKFFKLDAIYRKICEPEEKKAPRKRKPAKKKAVPASLSQ